jgi:DNA polymerase-3 subunit beta
MKIVVGQEALAATVGRVCGPALGKTSMPILNNLLLEVEGKTGLRISANSLSLGMTGVVAVDVEKKGRTTIPAKMFRDMARALPKGSKVTIETIKEKQEAMVAIIAGKTNYKIASLPADDFPALLVTGDDTVSAEFTAGDVRALVNGVVHAVSKDEGRPHLNAALFTVEEGKLLAISSDGHCLSKAERPANGAPGFTTMLSRALLKQLGPLLADVDAEEPVEVQMSKDVVQFKVEVDGEEVGLVGKVTDARFPPWKKVIPTQHNGTIVVNKSDLSLAITRAMLVRSKGPAAVMTVSPNGSLLSPDGSLKVEGEDSNVGEAYEDVIASYDGPEDIVVAINTELMMNALGAISAEEIKIKMIDEGNALVITGSDEDPMGVVMPMRM